MLVVVFIYLAHIPTILLGLDVSIVIAALLFLFHFLVFDFGFGRGDVSSVGEFLDFFLA